MPTIGGVTIRWDETKPAGGDAISVGDEEIRSKATSVRAALAAEHIFDAAGGANSGAHVFGSARPFYGAQSAVSSTGSDGRVMITSDSSRIFGVGSGGTVFLGGATAISAGSYPGAVPQRHVWILEFGEDKTTTGVKTVTIPNSGYSGKPFVVASFLTAGNVATQQTAILGVANVTATTFDISSHNTQGGLSSVSFNWMSMGTRAL